MCARHCRGDRRLTFGPVALATETPLPLARVMCTVFVGVTFITIVTKVRGVQKPCKGVTSVEMLTHLDKEDLLLFVGTCKDDHMWFIDG